MQPENTSSSGVTSMSPVSTSSIAPTAYDIVSPADGQVYKTIPYQSKEETINAVQKAKIAVSNWKKVPLEERKRLVGSMVDHFKTDGDNIATELAWLIGRPKKYNFNEIRGFEERARYLISIAEESLQDHVLPQKDGFRRWIKKEPLGVIFAIAAWNYPYLIAVNILVPALLAGNAVLLKHAPQTFPCAERLIKAAHAAGIPSDIFQALYIDHDTAASVIQHPDVAYVQFTGSVKGGLAVNQTASSRFINVGLELGGNDAAYVREDANVAYAAENLVDGAMYNSGQSCCGIQRVYCHENVYGEFVAQVAQVTHQYMLGHPLEDKSTLGPVVTAQAANAVREIIQDAVGKGATLLVDEATFAFSKPGTAYIAPQILLNVNHTMRIMSEEAFGPVMGIMKVSSDEQAIQLMNDSVFGLTASIWTSDESSAATLGEQLETGTVFMNRCDYLDPGLAWVGVKNSGKGCSLSKFGFDQVTRPKSFHLRVSI